MKAEAARILEYLDTLALHFILLKLCHLPTLYSVDPVRRENIMFAYNQRITWFIISSMESPLLYLSRVNVSCIMSGQRIPCFQTQLKPRESWFALIPSDSLGRLPGLQGKRAICMGCIPMALQNM